MNGSSFEDKVAALILAARCVTDADDQEAAGMLLCAAAIAAEDSGLTLEASVERLRSDYMGSAAAGHGSLQ
ncbi:hypothetical protein [uncultured Roseibium sp.]|uniref:hypothetical protein n=1 Tax=uncultured Roseibium sp. TaxID=1936171 RepID=UPI00262E66C9|nr:hypothetical protein [uncultured Roseibium sp.]